MFLPYYLGIKNRYCIGYFGYAKEYLLQLKLLCPVVEEQLKGLEIILSCRDDYLSYLNDYKRVITEKDFINKDYHLGHRREIKGGFYNLHPVEQLLVESDIKDYVITRQADAKNKLCAIFTNGTLPTKNMTNSQIDYCRNIAFQKGFQSVINPTDTTFGWVISVENEQLFTAASQGIKTSLLSTGQGASLYKTMFPSGEILKI